MGLLGNAMRGDKGQALSAVCDAIPHISMTALTQRPWRLLAIVHARGCVALAHRQRNKRFDARAAPDGAFDAEFAAKERLDLLA